MNWPRFWKIVAIVVGLWIVISNPHGAAALVSNIFGIIVAALDGITQFFFALF